MADLMIDREVLIEAPVEVVWRTLTEPDQISLWFADRVELVVEPGAHGFMEFGEQGGPVFVEVVDPPARFSFRWNHARGKEPVAGNSMLVEFTLTPGPWLSSPRSGTGDSGRSNGSPRLRMRKAMEGDLG
jgi:uncharacterized protein YndB with AHSA1/START domain